MACRVIVSFWFSPPDSCFLFINLLFFDVIVKIGTITRCLRNGCVYIINEDRAAQSTKVNSYYHIFFNITPFLKCFILVIIFIGVSTIASVLYYFKFHNWALYSDDTCDENIRWDLLLTKRIFEKCLKLTLKIYSDFLWWAQTWW